MNLFVLPSLYLRFAHGRARQEPMPDDPGGIEELPVTPNGDAPSSEPLQVSLHS
jgi:hypothetical protein